MTDASPPPPATPPKPEPSASTPPRLAPLWVALALVAGLAAWPFVQPRTTDEARFADLQARLDALPKAGVEPFAARVEENAANLRVLAERIAKLESAGASKDALGKIEESQDALAVQNKTLGERLAKSAADTEAAIRQMTETVDSLERRVTVAEAKIEAGTGAPAALALGFGQLRQALARSGPYGEALERFRAIAKNEPAIGAATEALGARAREGVPSLDELRGRFAEVARRAGRGTRHESAGLWGEIADRLSSLVVIRRVGEVSGETAEALVARAETRLAAGDLAAAVALVEKLSGDAGRVAADWLAAARARVEVERALADIESRIGERLGKAAGRS